MVQVKWGIGIGSSSGSISSSTYAVDRLARKVASIHQLQAATTTIDQR